VLPVPFHDDIIHLGFVDEQEKWDALAACDWLVMPSPHESLSMVLLEAWSVGRPAHVNGECDVLRSQCEQANAGLWYDDYEGWTAILKSVGAPEKDALGQQGASFVATNYSWERVESDYVSLLS
jgi:glycosyltransferase involved in cell wall biosynthesis